MRRRARLRLAAVSTCVVAAALIVAACRKDGAPHARFLSIATGGTGGVYYPYGGGIAKVLNENIPGVRASAEVTAASVDNLKLIREKKADVAFTLADTLADA
ncbi:MAG: C4-dicarboxylate ABC transporter substrate-binding protein, partial [Acidobacteria bacterium]|nr:C4-dicarboxylate ABC transporter substrate-binding protein [Acidobacteriota bacterium]